MYDLVIIGAGPAGMMAAIAAAESGGKVLLVEKNPGLGKKILVTGNGRCNISNRKVDETRYHGSINRIFNDVYPRFDNLATEKFFEDLGVKLKEENSGRLFPTTDKATTVVEALSNKLHALGVKICSGYAVKNVSHEDNWETELASGEKIHSRTLLLATGGKAAHALGSSGDGLFWAMKLGHKPTPIYAALVALETEEAFVKDVMGVKLAVIATSFADGVELRQRQGDMLFTHYGVSGPAVMGLAGSVAPYIGKGKVTLSINLVPEQSAKTLDAWLLESFAESPKKQLANVLADILPLKLAKKCAELLHLATKNVSEISKTERKELLELLQKFPLTVSKVRPLKEAQVTSGGIPVDEVTARLESRVQKGLFFAGEILDIDGDSGGFNLQWAWSSGYVAGKAAIEEAK